jgi:hypothetical protein
VEANLHLIQAVSKHEHSSNVTVTAVPSIRSTKLHGVTSITQYLVAKQIQNTKRHDLLPFYASPITFIEIFVLELKCASGLTEQTKCYSYSGYSTEHRIWRDTLFFPGSPTGVAAAALELSPVFGDKRKCNPCERNFASRC